MTVFSSKRIPCRLTLILLVAAYLTVTFFSLTWRTGDEGRYYVLARSLAEGHGYVHVENPLAPPEHITPPGYPLLLTLVINLLGPSVSAIKIMGSLFYLISVLFIYFTIRALHLKSAFRELSIMLLGICSVSLVAQSSFIMADPFCLATGSNLMQLNMEREGLTRADRFRFWRAYAEASGIPSDRHKRVMRRVIRKTRKRWKKRGWL